MHNNSYEGKDCIAKQNIELPIVIVLGKRVCVDGCVFLLYVNGDLATPENEKRKFVRLSKGHFILCCIYSFQLSFSVFSDLNYP